MKQIQIKATEHGSRPSELGLRTPSSRPTPPLVISFIEVVNIMILTDRAEALFASSLQPSDNPDQVAADDAIRTSIQVLGTTGCAAIMAAEFGEHPEAAAARMRWALSLARSPERMALATSS